MPKRKRTEDGDSAREHGAEDVGRTLHKIIDQGVSRVAASLEQARRFERQKLGKRQQAQSHSDSDGRRLNVEIAVLKSLNMRDLARQKIHKNLIKTQSIAKTGMLPEDVKLPSGGQLDKPTADIMARLFKHRNVVENVDETMRAVRQVLGLQINGMPKERGLQPLGQDAVQPINTKAPASDIGKKPAMAQLSLSDSEEEFKDLDELLDSSSESNINEAVSADVESDSSISSSDVESKAKSKQRAEKDVVPKASASAFLPSLSGGGYMSGSDSDATDVEDHVAPRKNRRGQRARQAIWEKKFKDKAKHLKDPPKKKNKRDDGWDAQRGAVGEGHKRNSGFGDRVAGRGKKAPSGGNAAPLGKDRKLKAGQLHIREEKPKHRDDQGGLHPSWEAKKMAKQQNAGIGGFKGKKMTFD